MTKNMAEYMKNRRANRRAELHKLLGNKCCECGATEILDMHHVDPKSKLFTVGSNLDGPMNKLIEEARKCVLLCVKCHNKITAEQNSVDHGYGLSGKRNCPCVLCKKRKAEYMKAYGHPNRNMPQ